MVKREYQKNSLLGRVVNAEMSSPLASSGKAANPDAVSNRSKFGSGILQHLDPYHML